MKSKDVGGAMVLAGLTGLVLGFGALALNAIVLCGIFGQSPIDPMPAAVFRFVVSPLYGFGVVALMVGLPVLFFSGEI